MYGHDEQQQHAEDDYEDDVENPMKVYAAAVAMAQIGVLVSRLFRVPSFWP